MANESGTACRLYLYYRVGGAGDYYVVCNRSLAGEDQYIDVPNLVLEPGDKLYLEKSGAASSFTYCTVNANITS